MKFTIDFADMPDEYPYDNPTVPAARGWLVLGEDHEGFLSNLSHWTRHEYRSQWVDSLSQLVAGSQSAVLITDYLPPDVGSYLEWWSFYRDGADAVHIQNQMVVYERLSRSFSIESAVDFLGNRETETEDGRSISEWSVTIAEIQRFLREVRVLPDWQAAS